MHSLKADKTADKGGDSSRAPAPPRQAISLANADSAPLPAGFQFSSSATTSAMYAGPPLEILDRELSQSQVSIMSCLCRGVDFLFSFSFCLFFPFLSFFSVLLFLSCVCWGCLSLLCNVAVMYGCWWVEVYWDRLHHLLRPHPILLEGALTPHDHMVGRHVDPT